MTTDNIESWSETASSNADVGGAPVAEGTMFVPHINNALRNIMSQVAKWTGADTIASATTTDLSTVQGQYVSVTGTTTITGLGTVKAGWIKMLVFSDALTFTHNATSLILPGGASITTAAGDAAFMLSLGSGNWRCISYTKADGSSIASSTASNVALLDAEDQALTGGVIVTSDNLGTISSGTVTPDPGDRPMAHYTNGGAHTLAPSSNIGSLIVDITNNGSAGDITTSGFTKVDGGNSLTTTNGDKFRCVIIVGNAGSSLDIKAMQ